MHAEPAIAIAVAALTALAALPGCGDSEAGAPPEPAVLALDVTRIAALSGPAGVAHGFGSVWVAEKGGPVLRIDPATGRVRARIRAANDGIVATGAGGVWLSDFGADRVLRIDPATDRVVARIPTGPAPSFVATSARGVWVALHHGNRVERIDPATNRVTARARTSRLDIDRGGPQGIAIAGRRVWTGIPVLEQVVPVDAATARAGSPVPTSQEPCGQIAAAGDVVWVSPGGCGFRLMRIDARRGRQLSEHQLARADVGDPLIVGRSLWVTTGDGVLHRLDARTGRVLARGRIGLAAVSLAPAGPRAFVAAGAEHLVRIVVRRARAAGG